jgi:hypothetical protein
MTGDFENLGYLKKHILFGGSDLVSFMNVGYSLQRYIRRR